MASYKRFEDLPVWQKAADLAARMFSWTKAPLFRGVGDLANQIQRATLSISNNIAEGFERGSTAELIQYLYIARGSAGEVRSMMCVMDRMPEFDELKSEIPDLKSEFESVSRQIRAWLDSLQNSEIKGQRHLNEDSKAQYDSKQRPSEFWAQMDKFKAEHERQLNEQVERRRNQID